MSPCPKCSAQVIHVKLRCSKRLALAEPTVRAWTNPNRRNPGVRVITNDGAVIVARLRTAELSHRVGVDGWAVHRCDELFKI